jgi:GT2 family glycosyltransferase
MTNRCPETGAASPVHLIIVLSPGSNVAAGLLETVAGDPVSYIGAGSSCTLIDDGSGNSKLREWMGNTVTRPAGGQPFRPIHHESETGFARSVNEAIRSAPGGMNTVILYPDVIPDKGTIAELIEVANSDAMTGFVAPRSNAPDLSRLPHAQDSVKMTQAGAKLAFRQIASRMPRYHFVPVVPTFCLLIRGDVLDEFGFLDETLPQGMAELDLLLRANRCGYVAALANRAYAYCTDAMSSSFNSLENDSPDANEVRRRYPEVSSHLKAYLASDHCHAEQMIAALAPESDGRLSLAFDLTTVGAYHNGTFESAKKLLVHMGSRWQRKFHIYAMVAADARLFHSLDEIDGVTFLPPSCPDTRAIAFRFGQPFDLGQLQALHRSGVVNVWAMLDPIAFDCLYLRHSDLPEIWRAVFAYGDSVIYISDFTAEQFRHRFPRRHGLLETVCRLSLDLNDYASADATPTTGEYILVIGNAFEHKRVAATVKALSRAFPSEKIACLGECAPSPNVVSHASGKLTDAAVDALMRRARFVIYPSTYEGFGMPVIRSLACRKPVLARSIPAIQEIGLRLDHAENLILFSSLRDLIDRLRAGFPEWKPSNRAAGVTQHTWDTVADEIGSSLCRALEEFSFDALVRRIRYYRSLEHTLAEMTSSLNQSRARLADLEASWSWKITSPLRVLGSIWLRLMGG